MIKYFKEMIDKHQILLKSLYFEGMVTKDFEKFKELSWNDENSEATVEYYKDNIYKQIITYHAEKYPQFIRYFNDFNTEKQLLTLHRLDGPALNDGRRIGYYINGKELTYIEFLALTKVKPENREDMKDLLDV